MGVPETQQRTALVATRGRSASFLHPCSSAPVHIVASPRHTRTPPAAAATRRPPSTSSHARPHAQDGSGSNSACPPPTPPAPASARGATSPPLLASPTARRPSPTRLRPAPNALFALPARRLRPAPNALFALPARRFARRSRSPSSPFPFPFSFPPPPAPLLLPWPLLPMSSLSHLVWCRHASSRTVDARARPSAVDRGLDPDEDRRTDKAPASRSLASPPTPPFVRELARAERRPRARRFSGTIKRSSVRSARSWAWMGTTPWPVLPRLSGPHAPARGRTGQSREVAGALWRLGEEFLASLFSYLSCPCSSPEHRAFLACRAPAARAREHRAFLARKFGWMRARKAQSDHTLRRGRGALSRDSGHGESDGGGSGGGGVGLVYALTRRASSKSSGLPARILKPPSQAQRKVVRALYDFSGSSDELAFKAGD
ncbi:hypothetical protein FB451DRAFT_1392460 [Mycena latifolia]|nr:hypothetical protein FB451DRAFT_1392460 [Mycena latifolia]